jgi:tetratricopeptide (TPR) repeat protein
VKLETARVNEKRPGPPAAPFEDAARSRSGRSLTHPLTALLALALLAVAVYSNTFSAAFHFDDMPNLVENPDIKHLANLLDLSGSRYVGFLTFALNYRFGALSVFGYHLVNLLIHITNGALVYALVRLLFRAAHTSPASPLSPAHAIALSTALLFVAHPIQTQAVTYIVQRFASLAALFYLLTVIAYLKWRLSSPESKRRHLWYAAAFLATVLGMKTKEITFTLPFMLLLLEVVFFGPPTRKQWLALIPFFLALPIIPLSRPGALGEGEAGFARDAFALSRPDYLFTQFRVIMTYLRLLVLPVDQNLDYDYPASHSLLEPPVFLSFLFLSALFAAAVYLIWFSRRAAADPRLRLIGFGLLWFFVTLSIESSVIPIRDVIYEHRLYLPSAGLFLSVGVAALGFSDRWKIPRAIAVGLLIVVLAGIAHQRNLVWKDELSLWMDVIQKSPKKARGYLSLGAAYAEQGMQDKAIQAFKTTLTLNPGYAEAHNNLGNIYKAKGLLEEAVQEYKTAVTIKPDYAMAHNNLGVAYQELGRFDEAFQEYQTAVKLEPDQAQAHYNLGNLYRDQKRSEEAIREYKTAITLNPGYAEAHNNLGNLYTDLGRLQEAIKEYQTALSLNPNHAELHNNLGNAYNELGDTPEAIREYQSASKLKADYSDPHSSLAVIYKKLGRPEEAIQEYQAIIAMSPDRAEPHNNLGNLYKSLGRTEEAVREYQIAITLKPDYVEAHYNLGLGYYGQGHSSEALEEFEKTVRLKADFAEAHNNLGVIYKETRRLKEAIREFQAAVKLKPTLAEAYYNLGDSLQQSGRTREAIPAFEEALRIKPDYEKARQALKALGS